MIGIIVGMGVGFILGALVKVERAKVEIRPPRGLGFAAFLAIGTALIGLGLNVLGLLPHKVLRFLGGVALIALGLLAIGAGVWAVKR